MKIVERDEVWEFVGKWDCRTCVHGIDRNFYNHTGTIACMSELNVFLGGSERVHLRPVEFASLFGKSL